MATDMEQEARIAGIGCMPHDAGVAFRVWAPHADRVSVVGNFNDWQEAANPMEQEPEGHWYTNIPHASIGDEYRYLIFNGENQLSRIDPRAREVTNSVGNAVIHDPEFDWEGDTFRMPSFNELVIYEMHVGTFLRSEEDRPGTFEDAAQKLYYLKNLGINCIELMPTAEFAGDYSWGYNPAHIYAVESIYGGPRQLKEFVKAAHRHGLAVVLDVVYNHFGPSDLHLWQFDGWSENDKGGIYFYNDWRAATPWGNTRPDYGRPEVRSFIRDNAMMWVEDFHMDGLRYDMTLYMRSVDGTYEMAIPEGWSLAQWINNDINHRFPRKITIAEDLQNNDWITKPSQWGGAGFSSQWDSAFVHPVRELVQQPEDEHRRMYALRDAMCHRYNLSAFERVVYTESHDEVANGKQRVPSEIDPDDPHSWFAEKKSTLAACMALTAPGIPMLFQGQEFLRSGWFDDSNSIDWDKQSEYRGLVRLYRDLIRLRRNSEGISAGLTGQRIEFHHLNDENKVIGFRRWKEGDVGGDVIVIANFANRNWQDYRVGFVRDSHWCLRFNSDARCYSEKFGNIEATDIDPEPHPYDGFSFSAKLAIAPYSVLIYSERSP